MTKEELYLSILDNIQDGVYYVDIHRKIKFWNKGAEQITGSDGQELKVTISVGVTVSKPQDTPDDIIKRVDSLMYQSKHNGRNMVSTDVSAENI